MKASERNAHYENLRELVFHAGEQFPQTQFYLSADPDLPFITGQALLDACGQFGSWINRRGQSGCHVALLGPNSAAWLTCFFAAVSSGCAAVPLYYGSPLEDQVYCLARSDSAILLYDKRCEKDAIALRDRQPGLEIFEMHALLYDLDTIEEPYFPPLRPDDPCALFFTSGTTEQSRCVILTNRNLGAMTSTAMNILPLSAKDTGLSVMPPSHTFEMMTNIVGALHCGGTLYINQSLRTVKANLKKHEPTVIVSVPLMLQMLQKEILREVRRKGRTAQFEKALQVNAMLRRFRIDISKKLFAEVYAVLGRNLKYFICGGAALDPELISFFDGLGITVIQGYGITECSPIVSCNTPTHNRPGSIGRVFPPVRSRSATARSACAARASRPGTTTTRRPPPSPSAKAGSTRATWAISTRTVICSTPAGAKISSCCRTAKTSPRRRWSRSSTAWRASSTRWCMSARGASSPRSTRTRSCSRTGTPSGARSAA